MKAATAAHKAHSHQGKLDTGGTTGQMGPPPRESLGQSFVSSAIQSPTLAPTTTAADRVRFGMRVIKASESLPGAAKRVGSHIGASMEAA
jgi:hypothetical protein